MCLQIDIDHYFIRNTQQQQLFNKFLHESNHSVLIEILLCDSANSVLQQQQKNEAVFWSNFCLLLDMKTISYQELFKNPISCYQAVKH